MHWRAVCFIGSLKLSKALWMQPIQSRFLNNALFLNLSVLSHYLWRLWRHPAWLICRGHCTGIFDKPAKLYRTASQSKELCSTYSSAQLLQFAPYQYFPLLRYLQKNILFLYDVCLGQCVGGETSLPHSCFHYWIRANSCCWIKAVARAPRGELDYTFSQG